VIPFTTEEIKGSGPATGVLKVLYSLLPAAML